MSMIDPGQQAADLSPPDAHGLPPQAQSPGRIVLGRLLRNKPALIGAAILVLLYLGALFAGFLSPYSPYGTSPQSDQPPHRVRFVDVEGNFHWRPFVYKYELTDLLRRSYVVNPEKRYPIQFFVKGEPYKLWWLFDCETRLFGLEGGAADGVRLHLFGTDRIGRDIFSRVLHGGQISLSIGVIGIVVSMSLGMLMGGISGYFGGWIDNAIQRFIELMMSIPGLYLILALRAALMGDSPLLRWIFGLRPDEHLSSGQVYVLIVGILGFIGWGGTARVIRGMVLSVRQLDFVQAARALGASRLRQIVVHILPNTLTYVIVSATLSVPGYILGEVALSFLGVGIEEPTASWGLMLQDGQNLRALTRAPWVLIPGAFIFATVFAFNFLGDGLRDALDPKAMD